MLELNGTAFGPMQQSYGGDTFNTAVYLSRCGDGVIKTSYATALGDDALSLELERRWAQDGLALDLVRHIPGRMPGLYQIQVDAQGERRFSFWRDSSAAKAYFDVAETPLEARIDEWDAFTSLASAWPSCPLTGEIGSWTLPGLCERVAPRWSLTTTTDPASGQTSRWRATVFAGPLRWLTRP